MQKGTNELRDRHERLLAFATKMEAVVFCAIGLFFACRTAKVWEIAEWLSSHFG